MVTNQQIQGDMMPTAIEWTEETWNPATGCTKVSAGCDNCYAERITERFRGKGSFKELVLHPDRLETPKKWRKPRTVFVNSMSDLFHAEIPQDFIAQVFGVMALTPRHTYQVLTKRPGRMRALLTDDRFILKCRAELYRQQTLTETAGGFEWPLRNVWVGVSVEDQEHADKRIPSLMRTPAAVRFLSCEPLLGPVSLTSYLDWMEYEGDDGVAAIYRPRLGWVIVGGESGINARPMDPAWARRLRDECVEAGVPFFFKQWGGRTPKANGRELDGRTWDQMPTSRGFTTHDEEG